MSLPVRISQFVAGFSGGDAISNYALQIDSVLRRLWPDVSTEIYSVSRHISPRMRNFCSDYRAHKTESRSTDINIYHFSVGSEITDYFCKVPGRKIIVYHNITPAKYYRGISEDRVRVLMDGREQLKELVPVTEVALAVSDFNRRELADAGFKNPEVMPLVVNLEYLKTAPSRSVINKFKDDWTNILFVGRLVPNKRFEDLIRIFYYYKKSINPASRLFLVGSFAGLGRYLAYLRGITAELDLSDVFFSGHVKMEELLAYYKLADLFLCMSEHEGFCIPLLEAMSFDVPVIAYEQAAIPETLNGAGILLKHKNFEATAELIDEVLNNKQVTQEILVQQRKRLLDFDQTVLERRLKEVLNL
ncbi:MAG: glycosyltransferase family 4 protein [Candidatus Theseobacter exili]|nr:glycosyltransferase family 4 protein [Candidatus Theseobacter exili]